MYRQDRMQYKTWTFTATQVEMFVKSGSFAFTVSLQLGVDEELPGVLTLQGINPMSGLDEGGYLVWLDGELTGTSRWVRIHSAGNWFEVPTWVKAS